MTNTIHQEIELPGTPADVYAALIDPEKCQAFSGAPASIDATPGGAFSCFGGQIEGHTLALQPNRCIVQAWRVAAWPEEAFSLIRIDLDSANGGTKLTLNQSGHPEDAGPHLDGGWHKMYWEPLKQYLS